MPDLLAHRFHACATARPDTAALIDATGATSYGALHDRVLRAARALHGLERIALLPRGEVDSVAVVLGAMTSGTSVVLVDRHLTAGQARRVLAVAEPALVVASGRLPAGLAGLDPARMRRPAHLLRDAPGAIAEVLARPADELLGGLTSGTTGEPKLFVRDQASWATTLERSDATFDVHPGDVVATPGPLDHGHFFYGALHALTRGATVDLRPLARAFAADDVTHAYLVPTLAVDLVGLLGTRRLARVREVVSSAAPWPEPARRALADLLPTAAISHFYGASELSFVSVSRTDEHPPSSRAGRLFEGVEVAIRDPDGAPVAAGERGLIHVRSDMLFAGYLTPGGLVGGPDAAGWASVGDLGSWRDGWLSLTGRASETIVSGGFNVEPAHVEQALIELAGVADAACVGLPDERWGAIPVAVLTLDGHAAPGRAQVRMHLREHLPQPSRPRRVFVADTLPRSPRGKLRRADIVAAVLAGEVAELA